MHPRASHEVTSLERLQGLEHLVGVAGEPSGGPIYAGPCAPRTGTHDDCPHHRARRAYDRLFDWFYMWK
jgi:hypothetical protein